MNSDHIGRRLAAVLGGAALISMGAVLAGCANGGNQAPTTSTTTTPTTTTSSTAPASPTEKSISPTGGNLFTPPVSATPAPNVPAGQHPGINGIS
jgi:hypothetical protein